MGQGQRAVAIDGDVLRESCEQLIPADLPSDLGPKPVEPILRAVLTPGSYRRVLEMLFSPREDQEAA